MAMSTGGTGRSRPKYQRNALDRRVAGAVDHLYGHHAAQAEPIRGKGPGRAEGPAAASTLSRIRLTLVIAINQDTKAITLNNEPYGDVDDTDKLTQQLREIFKERENNGVFREGTNEIEKTVFIKSPKTVQYGDVVRVIDAAKTAGADADRSADRRSYGLYFSC